MISLIGILSIYWSEINACYAVSANIAEDSSTTTSFEQEFIMRNFCDSNIMPTTENCTAIINTYISNVNNSEEIINTDGETDA